MAVLNHESAHLTGVRVNAAAGKLHASGSRSSDPRNTSEQRDSTDPRDTSNPRDSAGPVSGVVSGVAGDAGVRSRSRAPSECRRLDFADVAAPRLTHYLFRFPAKFHPPVVHSLLRSYTTEGQTVLDPFCGSGTLLVSAAAEGRHAVGVDVDPVAVFVSRGKTHRYQPGHLKASWRILRSELDAAARPADEYTHRRFEDISVEEYRSVVSSEALWIPDIPNLMHWFRRYVIIDLARIAHRIDRAGIPGTHRAFFRLVFASIIRNASNADPVPVSGLEVTAHMRALDAAGRLVDPFKLFRKAVGKGLVAVEDYRNAARPGSKVRVIEADSASLGRRLRRQADAVITSPPYHSAVDYYRRHQLEMFWLKLTATHDQRLELRPKYIGRPDVRKRDPILARRGELGPLAAHWEDRIRPVSSKRADAFVHYIISMQDVFAHLRSMVRPSGPAVFVLGHSEWNGHELPTSDLFAEIAGDHFTLTDRLWYPIKNRYMSYKRHNGAGINTEHVLVFKRSGR